MSWTSKGLALTASMLAGLVAAEWSVGLVRGGAYPYLNIFVADPELGVRLEASAETLVRSRTGRVTTIETNSLGLRDPERSRASETVSGRLLLLGDSQMFAYGVERSEGLAAQLETRLGGEVINAAVPTWGPIEYDRVLSELGEAYRPSIVLYTANVANDWLEHRVPNTRRTTALDGWALRQRRAREQPAQFPGRAWLMGRSHLVLMARTVARTIGEPIGAPAHMIDLITDQLDRLRASNDGHRSPLTSWVVRAREHCRRLGCSVHALLLPLDVQVDAREWAKYHTEPRDLTGTEVLLDDLAADLRTLGIEHTDLRPVLRSASPGAFLPDDYHLSPDGHGAIADALMKELSSELARYP